MVVTGARDGTAVGGRRGECNFDPADSDNGAVDAEAAAAAAREALHLAPS